MAAPSSPRRAAALRFAPVALALGLAAAAPCAQAQAVATAGARGDELTTAQQIDAWTHDDSPPVIAAAPRGARGPGLVDSPWADGLAPVLPTLPYDAPPIARTLVDGRIHGEFGAEGGNRGYGGYAVASGPLGDHGAVQVGVSDFHGTGGPRWSGWNGDHRSLNIVAAFDFSRDRKAAAASDTPSPAY